jgi:phi13 family phage major tail protein
MGKGVPIGLRNLVYAKLVDDPAGGTASYEAPKLIAGAISANVNPNSSTDTLFADDGPYETASTVGQIQLEVNVADLPLEVQADLFGHTISGGRLSRKSGDIPPWVAVGFKSLKSNGRYRYTWLSKGKFGLPEQNNATKGDSIEFNTPTATGSFVKRESDDEWESHIDEDHIDYVSSMGANWFNDPFGGLSDTIAPAVDTVTPADAATAVAVGGNITWNFSEPLALSTVHTGNFLLINDATGAGIDGVLSMNASRDSVTFDPTANLATATAYRAIVTTGVTDLAGNKLDTAHVIEFTTA